MKNKLDTTKSDFNPEGYENWRQEIEALIAQAKYTAALNVNAELLVLS
ncbi:MAG: hypothetical protein ACTTKO_06740 [Candidatus Limimorpha sp.]